MELKFIRTDDAIETKLILDGDEQIFDYLLFINKLIDGTKLEEITYPDDVSDDEKKEIDSMVEKINSVIVENPNDEGQ